MREIIVQWLDADYSVVEEKRFIYLGKPVELYIPYRRDHPVWSFRIELVEKEVEHEVLRDQ